jgi:uncharacterized protein
MNPRVVFDTNVLVSAIGWGGTPGRCVEFARDNRVHGLTCVEVLGELAEKLSGKLGMDDGQIAAALAALLPFLEVVAITGKLTGAQPDPKDDKILECAIAGSATHIVTGDRKHLLPLGRFRSVEIVTPAQLIELVEQPPA